MTTVLQGWSGLLAAYTVVQGGLVTGLIRGGAGIRKLAVSPLAALPLTVVAGTSLAGLASVAHAFGFVAGETIPLWAGLTGTAALGYGFGHALARRSSPAVIYERGAGI